MALINSQQSVYSVLDKIKSQNTNCLQVMKNTAIQVFQMTWQHESLSSQQVCDLMGTEVAKGFEAHAKLQELIYLIDPTWVPLVPPKSYIKNDDGTVTIQD